MGVRAGHTVLMAWGEYGIARDAQSTASEICISEVKNSKSQDAREVNKNTLICAKLLYLRIAFHVKALIVNSG